MLMKAADVSNPTKSEEIYDQWIERITTEFFAQGDRERALGLQISPFCNRNAENAGNVASSQKGFIQFIVAPLFEALNEFCPIHHAIEGLEKSQRRFCMESTNKLVAAGNSGVAARKERRQSLAQALDGQYSQPHRLDSTRRFSTTGLLAKMNTSSHVATARSSSGRLQVRRESATSSTKISDV